MIILALVALISLGAYAALGDAVSQKVDCAASVITGGGGPCGIANAGGSPASGGPTALERARDLVDATDATTAAERDWLIQQVAQLPDAVLDQLEAQGTRIVAAHGSVVDAAPELGGETPRGWGPGSGFDDVPGMYDPRSNQVVVALDGAGVAGGEPSRLIAHEVMHSIDFGGGGRSYFSSSAEFVDAYNRTEFGADEAYFTQGGKAGLEEAYAESFARYQEDPEALRRTWPALYEYWAHHADDFSGAPQVAAAPGATPAPWGPVDWVKDNVVDPVADGVGDVVDAGTDFAGNAWDAGTHVAGEAWNFTYGLGKGAVTSVWGTVTFLADVNMNYNPMVNPLAYKNWYDVATHPAETWDTISKVPGALWDGVQHDWDTLLHGSWGEKGEVLGQFVPDVAIAIFTGGAGTAATRGARAAEEVADAARLVNRVDDAADAARAASRIDDAAEAERLATHADDLSHLDDPLHTGYRTIHPPAPQWLQTRMDDTVAAVERGTAGPTANATDVRAFLDETYEHVNEVNELVTEMGGRARLVPGELPDGSFAAMHDFGERVPVSRVESLLDDLEHNPLRDRDGNLLPVPQWLKDVPGEARAAGSRTVDVSKLNPDVAAGLGRAGPPDPYSIRLHNLAAHHDANAFAPLASGAPNPNLVESVADRINAMRQPRVYRPTPMSYERIESILTEQVAAGELPAEAIPLIRDGIRAQQVLEHSGRVNPYYLLENDLSSTIDRPPSIVGPSSTAVDAPRPTMLPTVEHHFDGFKATWGDDPRAFAMFSEPERGVVDMTDIFRGSQPPGSAGVMVADALEGAGITHPTTVRFSHIIETQPTLEQIQHGVAVGDTVLGQTLNTAVHELGGRAVRFEHGIDELGKPWIEVDITYAPSPPHGAH